MPTSILRSENKENNKENEIKKVGAVLYIKKRVILFFVHCNKGIWGKKSIWLFGVDKRG